LGNKKKHFAIKSIPKQLIKDDLYILKRELQNIREVDHPHIIKFYEAFVDSKLIHMVFEDCTGGDLFDRIIK
jgi:serine/threonine protein kinase